MEGVQSALAELKGGRQTLELCAVINAFDVPKISYDPVGRKLYADAKPRSIFAAALVSLGGATRSLAWPVRLGTMPLGLLHLTSWPPLLSSQAKQQLYMDRLHLINQRIRRSSLFQPRSLTSGADTFAPQARTGHS